MSLRDIGKARQFRKVILGLAEWPPGLSQDAKGFLESTKFTLLERRVQFNLVHGGNNAACF
ncbi:unannotated protein [freshwater metagenome]|uniref:Unannotated protein n=1 Tax=freshwater metagenome TaxID=449393 RepID=A0A6J6KFA9_9ZZZZ